jgi:hypothetical protein
VAGAAPTVTRATRGGARRIPRAVARTPIRARAYARRPRPPAHSRRAQLVNAFQVCGSVLAAWALIVTFIGVTREDFPASAGAARVTAAISIVLTIVAIGAGIYTAATEEEGGEEEAALVLPR